MKDKEMEKLIDACYDVMFQRQGEMEELGLLNYGDSSYYIQNPDEYEKDKKICELENEVERLKLYEKALELTNQHITFCPAKQGECGCLKDKSKKCSDYFLNKAKEMLKDE